MKSKYTLTEEQLDQLYRGSPVEVGGRGHHDGTILKPPCATSGGHEWGDIRARQNPNNTIERRCKDCGERQEVEVNPEELFES